MRDLTASEKIMIMVIAILAILGVATCNKYRQAALNFENVAKLNVQLENKTKAYTDENGRLHTQIEKITVDDKAYRVVYEKQVDSLATLLGIKGKNITDLTILNTQIKGQIKTKVDTTYLFDTVYNNGNSGAYFIDTVRLLEFPYKDRWMAFNGKLNEKKGLFTADYTITDSLTIIEYTKGTGLFGLGAKKSYIDVSSSNPSFKVLNAKNIELKNLRNKPWSVGPYIGWGFSGTQWQPSVGISVQRTLFRF